MSMYLHTTAQNGLFMVAEQWWMLGNPVPSHFKPSLNLVWCPVKGNIAVRALSWYYSVNTVKLQCYYSTNTVKLLSWIENVFRFIIIIFHGYWKTFLFKGQNWSLMKDLLYYFVLFCIILYCLDATCSHHWSTSCTLLAVLRFWKQSVILLIKSIWTHHEQW